METVLQGGGNGELEEGEEVSEAKWLGGGWVQLFEFVSWLIEAFFEPSLSLVLIIINNNRHLYSAVSTNCSKCCTII